MSRRKTKTARTVRRNVQVVVTQSVPNPKPDLAKLAKAIIAIELAKRGVAEPTRSEGARPASDDYVDLV